MTPRRVSGVRAASGGVVAIVWLVVTGANAATDQCTANEVAKLLASDGAPGDYFGLSVSISGDVAIVGAYGDDLYKGSAYVFRYNGSAWVQEDKLIAFDGAAGDHFGLSVSISGDTAIVGAVYDDDNGSESGSAYVYRYRDGTWVHEQKLVPDDNAGGDRFGNSVSISGDTAVVGAYRDRDTGSAYVFRYIDLTWDEEAKLLPYDGGIGTPWFFGGSVSISGDVVVVGAACSAAGSGSGCAYGFRRNDNGTPEDPTDDFWDDSSNLLLPSDGAANDHFGTSVSISGDTAFIGAYLDDDNGLDSGSAYVFRISGLTWEEEEKLLAKDGAAGDQFGGFVSISGDAVIVGAYWDDDNGLESGSAYVYRYNDLLWNEEAKLLASDGAVDDHLGHGVSISGDTAFIGAYLDDDNGISSGSVYVFNGITDCQANGTVDLCDIADGTSNDVNGNGTPDECECLADLNGDGVVGIGDLLILLADWAAQCPPDCIADIDRDGTVGISDLLMLLANWGACPEPP